MALTSTHDVLIAGEANYNFPVTSNAYSANNAGSAGGLGFFAKVSEDGTQILYSSLLGSASFNLSISGIGQDLSGDVWFAGTTRGPLSALMNPLQSTFSLCSYLPKQRQTHSR
jgi:hypothetical protein